MLSKISAMRNRPLFASATGKASAGSVQQFLLIVFVFFSLALLLFGKVIFSGGHILGGDWGFPATASQLQRQAEAFCSTWYFNAFLQFRNINTSGCWLFPLFSLFAKLGVSAPILAKILLISVFTTAGSSTYLFLRYVGARAVPAAIGGAILTTSPLFFDYAVMGWVFVLLAVGLFPAIMLSFSIAVKDRSRRATIICSLLFAVAAIQSQAVVWVPILLLALAPWLVSGREDIKEYTKRFIYVVAIFGFLSLYFLGHMLLSPDKAASGSNLLKGSEAIGAMGHFYPFNILRGFGGLYNYQFETISWRAGTGWIMFILPLLAIGGLLLNINKRLRISLLLISLVPFFMWIMNDFRDFLSKVPFSNIIRDFPRFSVFSIVGYSLLSGLFLDNVFRRGRSHRYVFTGAIVLWTAGLFPWWSGKIFDWRESSGPDIRLRSMEFPEEYYKVEQLLAQDPEDSKALYLPYGLFVQMQSSRRFYGPFNSTADIFALHSALPGALIPTGRNLGDAAYENAVINGLEMGGIRELSKTHDLKYVVIRKNLVPGDLDLDLLESECQKYFDPYFLGRVVSVYKVRDPLPHFYISSPTMRSERSSVEFRRLAPTKYRLRFRGVRGAFSLVFLESYHVAWQLFASGRPIPARGGPSSTREAPEDPKNIFVWSPGTGKGTTIQNDSLPTGTLWETWFMKPLTVGSRFKPNGYANGWNIDPAVVCASSPASCISNKDGTKDFELVLEYAPQKIFYWGAALSALTLLACLAGILLP